MTRTALGRLARVSGELEQQVAGIAALNDPVRRALYRYVADSADPVSREQAATAMDVQKALAAFHLDKLAEQGLLDVEFRRLTGRTGPGAGRPAKLYRRSDRQIDLSLPPREYDLAGQLLAQAIQTSEASGRPVRAELEDASYAFGEQLGSEALARSGRRPSRAMRHAALLEALRSHGFEPRPLGRDVILANCPFHTLAARYTELVCGMNLHMMRGIHSQLAFGDHDLVPRLEPEAGQCCVKFCGAA